MKERSESDYKLCFHDLDGRGKSIEDVMKECFINTLRNENIDLNENAELYKQSLKKDVNDAKR